MQLSNFNTPQRVWINSPSTLQPYHKYHGKVGIAVKENNNIQIYLTEGVLVSMIIDPLYISLRVG